MRAIAYTPSPLSRLCRDVPSPTGREKFSVTANSFQAPFHLIPKLRLGMVFLFLECDIMSGLQLSNIHFDEQPHHDPIQTLYF